jgi:hypothetical protein
MNTAVFFLLLLGLSGSFAIKHSNMTNTRQQAASVAGHQVEGGVELTQALATTITDHCLPKYVCQLHALESTQHLSDSERDLISQLG